MLTPEQLEIRKSTIGSSESAAALGLSKWKTPLDVYMEKIGMAPQQEDNEAMYWGREFEEPIAKRYEKEMKCKLSYGEPVISKEHSFMSCTPDRTYSKIIDDANVIVECKNVGMFNDEWGTPGTDEIPIQYLIQVAHQAICWDYKCDYVDIAALGNRYDFRIYRYKRNAKLEEKIIEGLRKFWYENVLAQVPPAPKTISDLDFLSNPDNEKSIEADDELVAMWSMYRSYKATAKAANDEMEELKLKICSKMRDATSVTHHGNKIFTFNQHSRKVFESNKLLEDMPELKEKYMKETKYRMFNVKEIRE